MVGVGSLTALVARLIFGIFKMFVSRHQMPDRLPFYHACVTRHELDQVRTNFPRVPRLAPPAGRSPTARADARPARPLQPS